MRRNLISISKLVLSNYSFQFNKEGFSLFHNSIPVAKCPVECGLFHLNSIPAALNTEIIPSPTQSARLWHHRLGHISKDRIQRLVKEQILPSVDFSDLDVYVNCIKGKLTKARKKGSNRSGQLLEIIHTDICGPFPIQTLEGHRYFITFIDDYSRHPGPFAKYLQECGIVAQYTNLGTPEQNGVAERRNRTLKDMVRSMICNSQLPNYLWGEAIRTANYILNRVPSKAVSKTPFELWTNRKLSLNHLHIWGCKAEAKVFNPQEKKLDPKTISCFFVGYPEKTKGYRFYCPNHTTRLVETGRAVFLENVHEERKATDFIFEELGEIAIEPAKRSVQVPHISEIQGEDYEDMEPE
ncbi:unnamed protein product [Prunus armeniaca]